MQFLQLPTDCTVDQSYFITHVPVSDPLREGESCKGSNDMCSMLLDNINNNTNSDIKELYFFVMVIQTKTKITL